MAEEETRETGRAAAPEEGSVILVRVQEDKAQAVIDFVAGLQEDAHDVSGYMLSLGLVGGIYPGRLAAQTATTTNCRDTSQGKDQLCDADTWIT